MSVVDRNRVILELLESLKNQNIPYMLTRNISDLNTLQDIDILVRKKDIPKIKRILKQKLQSIDNNCREIKYKKLPGVEREGYLLSNGIFLKFDMIYYLDFKGIRILESRNYLHKRAENVMGIYVPFPEVEFLVIFVKELIKGKGKRIKSKYKDRLSELLANYEKAILKELVKILTRQRGKQVITYLKGILEAEPEDAGKKVHELRREVVSWVIWRKLEKNFLNFFANVLLYAIQITLFKLREKGCVIAFYGTDGSGKSTVIKELCNSKSKIPYFSDIRVFHLRPQLLPYLGEKVIPDNSLVREGNPYIKRPYSKFVASLKVFYYMLDYIVGYWIKIKPLLSKEYLVIFDRYYLDLVIDSERMRISLNKNFLFFIYRLLIPKPHISVYLEADPETIRQRKKDLEKDRIKELQVFYHRFLSSEKNLLMIDTSNFTPEDEKEIIRNYIVQYLSKK